MEVTRAANRIKENGKNDVGNSFKLKQSKLNFVIVFRNTIAIRLSFIQFSVHLVDQPRKTCNKTSKLCPRMGFVNGGSLQSPLTAVIRLNSANFDLQILLQQTRNNNTSSQFVYSGA